MNYRRRFRLRLWWLRLLQAIIRFLLMILRADRFCYAMFGAGTVLVLQHDMGQQFWTGGLLLFCVAIARAAEPYLMQQVDETVERERTGVANRK